jgi:hypothetical protein
VSVEPDVLARVLHSIAAQDAPPSGIDPARAAEDGRRILRRRRAAAGLGGTCAAVFITVAALSAGHVFGGGPVATPATWAQVVHAGNWDPLVAPAAFGWLPANAQNVNYSVAPGPGQGPAALAKGSQRLGKSTTDYPAFIWLTALDPSASAPKPGPANDGFGRTLIPAPDVNGRAAYWAVDPAKRDPDLGAAGILYFQSSAGRWANINGYYLGADCRRTPPSPSPKSTAPRASATARGPSSSVSVPRRVPYTPR